MKENRDTQVNLRLTPAEAESLDRRRAQMLQQLGTIPSRSEVIRSALLQYLGMTPKTKKP